MKMKHIILSVLFTSVPLLTDAQAQLKSGIDITDLDTSVSPSEDFYQYACGGWKKKHPLPAAYSRYGSFDRLADDNNKRINSILDELLHNNYDNGTTEQKLSDLYKLAMDSVRRNKEGVKPVLPLIKELENVKTVKALRTVQMKYASFGYGLPFRCGFGADEKNASQNIFNINQGGLTLGQKEYYLDNDTATASIREAYKAHIVRMFRLFGFDETSAMKKRDAIIKIETELAKASKSSTELRDVEANYNKMSLGDFKKAYPAINLEAFLNAEGIKTEYFKEMIVGQPDFLKTVDRLTANMTADELKAYMEWDVILSAANYLSDEVVEANFDFFGKTMSGRKQNHPKWKLATNIVANQMGEALGKMYAERYFPASSKARMETLVSNLQIALKERIEAQDWMSEATKQAALDKLGAFYVKIGYPNKWKDISNLTIDPKLSLYENIQNCRKFWDAWDIDYRAGKPVDRTSGS